MSDIYSIHENSIDRARGLVRLLLIRHATTDAVGCYLSGRIAGVSLNAVGIGEAQVLADALASHAIDAIYTSPLLRAVQTADAIAGHRPMRVRQLVDLQEIDFGEWTGRCFSELESDARWRLFNERRSIATIPGGESPAAAQRRTLAALARLSTTHAGETVAVVSHADIIRSALLHYLHRGLDDFATLTIEPASISEVRLSSESGDVCSINVTERGLTAAATQAPGQFMKTI
jgi:probable phosphoglycerate mutase